MAYQRAYTQWGGLGTTRARVVTDVDPNQESMKEAIQRSDKQEQYMTQLHDESDEEASVNSSTETDNYTTERQYTQSDSDNSDKEQDNHVDTNQQNGTYMRESNLESYTRQLKKRTFAASAASEAEERIAKSGRHPDGSKPVKVPKRIWRPKIRMMYKEPEALLDTSGDLDWYDNRRQTPPASARRHHPIQPEEASKGI